MTTKTEISTAEQNIRLASRVIEEALRVGCDTFCISPAGRNSPFVVLLQKNPQLRMYTFYDERSAAFFALGTARRQGRPVGVITTSGTAAGELLPAAMEAWMSQVPLLLITADRPSAYRGTGAPQSAEQVGLYSTYVEKTVDIEGDVSFEFTDWTGRQPIHLNVCFDEPLLSDAELPRLGRAERARPQKQSEGNPKVLQDFLNTSKHLFVIVGELDPQERPAVKAFLKKAEAPTLLECLSGLREDQELAPLRSVWPPSDCDAVLRIGKVPTTRLWRDLENCNQRIPVLSVSSAPFSGLTWGNLLQGDLDALFTHVQPPKYSPDFLYREEGLVEKLFKMEPFAEPTLFRSLSEKIPEGSLVYLGNSLPIREWDLAATFVDRKFQLAASRGLNGIDGQLSTFLGRAEEDRENWAILGDLTCLYDLSAPWIIPQLKGKQLTIVVINNGGGKIFERMFEDQVFQNRHQLNFEAIARFWGLAFERWEKIPHEIVSTEKRLIELVPDNDASDKFWRLYDQRRSHRSPWIPGAS